MPNARLTISLCALLLAAGLGGCSSYIRQAAAGQLELMRGREPVAQIENDPATPAQLRARLATAREALEFAHRELALPDNGSYRDVVTLDRQYVVWNVFATPEFSLRMRSWCFPVAGCVAYRGWFKEQDARAFAAELAATGDDVSVAGAAAYSTLGIFRDPLLSTVLSLSDRAVAGLIFHELAHQRVYARGDTSFNEGLATLVEQEGMLAWLETRGDVDGLCRYAQSLQREREVQALIASTRKTLTRIYRSEADEAGRRASKAAAFAALRADYRSLRAGWSGPPYFDAWFNSTLNNAVLGAAGAYNRRVDALRVIFESEQRDWHAFFRRMDRLRQLGVADRARVLEQITRPVPPAAPAACRATAG